MNIDDELIDHLCALSKLRFEGEDRNVLKKDLEKIVGFLNKLNDIDTEGVEPLIYMTDAQNLWREDEVNMEISKSEALQNAPKKDSDYFRVSKVRGKHNA
ncbi:MAG: Asp-tRNA(Asn)/Glu-tRNA(Gln) amidotransferase subunit GatC [Flavobacteriia bacterium]|nr:Asp-tRNA(Asn)/Glu-tRNA(Gln) amidotransferase subunit GatC [Flavobacteriia bacterium]